MSALSAFTALACERLLYSDHLHDVAHPHHHAAAALWELRAWLAAPRPHMSDEWVKARDELQQKLHPHPHPHLHDTVDALPLILHRKDLTMADLMVSTSRVPKQLQAVAAEILHHHHHHHHRHLQRSDECWRRMLEFCAALLSRNWASPPTLAHDEAKDWCHTALSHMQTPAIPKAITIPTSIPITMKLCIFELLHKSMPILMCIEFAEEILKSSNPLPLAPALRSLLCHPHPHPQSRSYSLMEIIEAKTRVWCSIVDKALVMNSAPLFKLAHDLLVHHHHHHHDLKGLYSRVCAYLDASAEVSKECLSLCTSLMECDGDFSKAFLSQPITISITDSGPTSIPGELILLNAVPNGDGDGRVVHRLCECLDHHQHLPQIPVSLLRRHFAQLNAVHHVKLLDHLHRHLHHHQQDAKHGADHLEYMAALVGLLCGVPDVDVDMKQVMHIFDCVLSHAHHHHHLCVMVTEMVVSAMRFGADGRESVMSYAKALLNCQSGLADAQTFLHRILSPSPSPFPIGDLYQTFILNPMVFEVLKMGIDHNEYQNVVSILHEFWQFEAIPMDQDICAYLLCAYEGHRHHHSIRECLELAWLKSEMPYPLYSMPFGEYAQSLMKTHNDGDGSSMELLLKHVRQQAMHQDTQHELWLLKQLNKRQLQLGPHL